MFNNLLSYFDLGLFPERPKFGKADATRKHQKIIWTLLLYLGVVSGVISSYIFNPTQQAEIRYPHTTDFISALIMAAVIYPTVYKYAKFNVNAPNIMQVFVAFQHGFFWESIWKFTSNKLVPV